MCVTFVQKYTIYLYYAKVVPFLCIMWDEMLRKMALGLWQSPQNYNTRINTPRGKFMPLMPNCHMPFYSKNTIFGYFPIFLARGSLAQVA